MSAEPIEDLAPSTSELVEHVRGLLRPTVYKHPWRDPNANEKCDECRRINPCWWVQPELWDSIMLADSRLTLCPSCFIRRAEVMGLGTHGSWQLYPPSSLF